MRAFEVRCTCGTALKIPGGYHMEQMKIKHQFMEHHRQCRHDLDWEISNLHQANTKEVIHA